MIIMQNYYKITSIFAIYFVASGV